VRRVYYVGLLRVCGLAFVLRLRGIGPIRKLANVGDGLGKAAKKETTVRCRSTWEGKNSR